MARDLARGRAMARRLAQIVPGGAHTYAKGPDQFPEDAAPVMARGRGAHVWDVDGNEYIEYGAGLRSLALGHAHPEVDAAVVEGLSQGGNFVRPTVHELEAAEEFLAAVPAAEMVKFAKNGSDVTTAAIRLARAVTGRSRVGFCRSQPFFSTDDWFIGTTPMSAGIPEEVAGLTVGFEYGDLASAERLFDAYPGEIACLILEGRTQTPPPPGYLQALVDLAHARGALVVFDEIINGFRLATGGAHAAHGVTPDLMTFGKAMGNGYSVSALAGRRDVMRPGGLDTRDPRVFLLSTTHGAEPTGLAAMRAVIRIHERDGVPEQLADIGSALTVAVEQAVAGAGLSDHIVLRGHPANLVFATLDRDGAPSQSMRTVFLRELVGRGVIGPSFVVSAALSPADIDRTAEVVAAACEAYAQALDASDRTPWMGGRSVQPVFRRHA